MIRHFIAFNIAFSLVFVACVTAPESGRKQLILVPESQMNAMGMQAYDEMKKTETVSKNAALTAMVGRLGRDIANASGKEYDWEFTLFDAKDTVNAFCLPGGKVGVYTGILPIAQNEAALAAIMGHEVAHAVLRHGAERVSQTLVVQLGVAAASLSFDNENYRRLIAGALGIGLQFGYLLPYSRKHESEADAIGMRFMAQAGYDPSEASGLWTRMAEAAGGRSPEFLSTHPDPIERAKTLEKLAASQEITTLYMNSDKKEAAKIKI